MSKQRIEFTLGFKADTAQAQRELETLASSLKKLSTSSPTILDGKQFNEASQAAFELEQHLEKAVNVNTGKLDLTKFASSLKSSGKDLQHYQQKLSQLGPEGKQAFNQLARSIANAEVPTVQINKHLASFLTTLKNTAKWQLTSNITHGLQSGLQQALSYAESLNKSLVDIQIVTSMSTAEMAKFAEQANKVARTLSVSTTDYTKASLIYFQQGLDEKEVEARAGITSKMAAVTGQTTETISDQLTSIWNNFYDGSKSLEYYADVLTRLGADTASSSDEIVQGLQKFSAVADTIGLSYEYAAASLATITSTTRESADVVGTALKTLFSRIQGLKLGETLEDGVDLNKYSEALDKVGVKVLDQNNELREMDAILDDLAAKWNTLGKAQQTSLAQTVAGVRQYTQLIALMDNWDFMQQNVQSGMNSEGSLNEQFSFYEQGVEASAQRVQTALQNVYSSLIDDQFLVQANNALTEVIDGMSGFIDVMGGLPGIITTISTILLSTFASKVPAALNSLGNFFRTTFGIARKETYQLQDATQEYIQTQLKATTNPVEQMELQGLEKLLEMRKLLTLEAKNMTVEEQEAYKIDIERVQKIYEMVKARTQDAEVLKSQLADQVEMMTRMAGNNTNNLSQAAVNKGRAFGAISQSKAFKQWAGGREDVGAGDFIREAEAGNITGLTDKDLARIERAKKAMAELEVVKQKGAGSYQQGAKEARQLTQEIEKLGSKYGALTVQTKQTAQSIAAMGDGKSELGKNHAAEVGKMIANFKKLAQEAGLSKQEINELLQNVDLKDANLGTVTVEKASAAFDQLTQNMYDYQMASDGDAEKTDTLSGKLAKLQQITGASDEQMQEFTATLLKEGVSAEELRLAFEKLNNTPIKPPKHFTQVSQAVASMGSALVSMGMQISSITSAWDTLSDDSASAATKIGAFASAAFSATFMIREFGKGWKDTIDVLSRSSKYIDKAAEMTAKAAKNGGKVTNIFAKMGTTVSEAGVATVSSAGAAAAALGPVLIALAAVAAVIATIVIAHKNWQKAAQESAKAVSEEVKANQELIDKNNELIKSMQTALATYKESGDNKQELDDATIALAEAYGVEGAAIAALTGNYKDYENVLKQVQALSKEEYANQAEKAAQAAQSAGDAAFRTGASTWWDNNRLRGDTLSVGFGGFGAGEEEFVDIAQSMLEEAGLNTRDYLTKGSGFYLDLDTSNYDELILAYEKLDEVQSKARKEMGADAYYKSGTAKEIDKWQAQIKEYIDLLKESQDLEQDNKLRATGLQYELDEIDNYEEYVKWIQKARVALGELYEDETEFQKLLNQLESYSSNNLIEQFSAYNEKLDQFKNKLSESDKEVENFWMSLSDEQRTLLMSLDIDYGLSLDTLNKYIEQLSQDVNILEIKVKYTKELEAISRLKDGVLDEEDLNFLKTLDIDWEKFGGWDNLLDLSDQTYVDVIRNLIEIITNSVNTKVDKVIASIPEAERANAQAQYNLISESLIPYSVIMDVLNQNPNMINAATAWKDIDKISSSSNIATAIKKEYGTKEGVQSWNTKDFNNTISKRLFLYDLFGITKEKDGEYFNGQKLASTSPLLEAITSLQNISFEWKDGELKAGKGFNEAIENARMAQAQAFIGSDSNLSNFHKIFSNLLIDENGEQTENFDKLITVLEGYAKEGGFYNNTIQTFLSSLKYNKDFNPEEFNTIQTSEIMRYLGYTIPKIKEQYDILIGDQAKWFRYINDGELNQNITEKIFFEEGNRIKGLGIDEDGTVTLTPDISFRYNDIDTAIEGLETYINQEELQLDNVNLSDKARKDIEQNIKSANRLLYGDNANGELLDANGKILTTDDGKIVLGYYKQRANEALANATTDFNELNKIVNEANEKNLLGEIDYGLSQDQKTYALSGQQSIKYAIAKAKEANKDNEEALKEIEEFETKFEFWIKAYDDSISTMMDALATNIEYWAQDESFEFDTSDLYDVINWRNKQAEIIAEEIQKALEEGDTVKVEELYDQLVSTYIGTTDKYLKPQLQEAKTQLSSMVSELGLGTIDFDDEFWREKLNTRLEGKQDQLKNAGLTEEAYQEAMDTITEIVSTMELIDSTEESIAENAEKINEVFDEIKKSNQEFLKDKYAEIDIFADINQKLTEQERILSRITDERAAAYGEDYVKNIEEENKALDEQIKLSEELQAKNQKMADFYGGRAKIKAIANGYVDDEGNILSMEDITIKHETEMDAMKAKLKEAEDAENKALEDKKAAEKALEEARATGDEELIAEKEDAYDTANTIWENANANTNSLNLQMSTAREAYTDYTEAWLKSNEFGNAAEDAADKAAEAARKQLENNFENWNYTLELGLEVNERDLEMLEYKLGKIDDDIYSVGEAWTLTNQQVASHFTGFDVINQSYENLTNLFNAGQIAPAKYAEGLKSIYSEAMEGAKSLDEIDAKMRTFYSDTLDLAIEQIDKYASALEHQTSVLEHYYNLITLINGEADYEKIGMILEGQAKTLENEMKFSTEQYQNAVNAQTEYQAFFDTLSDEDKKKYQANLDAINEQVREAEEEMLSDTEAWAEKLKEILENKMAEAGDILEKTFSGGMGFDSLNNSIDRLNDYQDIYLTKTNQVYEIQKLMRTAQQAADKTDNAAAKQRINNFVQETKKLQEKNKLSHLELEIQQAQYDMLMAQIALEEAKNAKTTVRLRRDSQGNFGYVYTADQEQVAKAEQELADAENRLYNISLEATNEWGQKRLELQQQYADAITELEERRANKEFETDEMYQQERDRITQEFYRNMEAYAGQYTIALNGHANTQADAWIRAYEDMMAESDKWNEATTQYLDANEKAYGEWKDEVAKNSAIVDGVLKNTQTEVQKVTDKSEELRKKGNEVAISMWTQVSAAQGAQKEYINLSRTVDDLRLDYLNMAAAAQSALDQISKINSLQMVNPYYTTYKNTNEDLSSLMTQHIASGGQIGDMKWEALTQIRDEKIQANGNISAFMTNAQIQQILSDYTNLKDSNPNALSVQWVNAILSGQANYTPENYQKFMEELEKRNWIPGIKLFDTGGYTGEWGPQGRLAVVHEKELVLKQDDTANFLLATGMLRNIASMIDLNAANSLLATGLQNPFAAAAYAPGTLDQNVTIEAHFPNATDRDEITEAFNTLINTASQYANRKTK